MERTKKRGVRNNFERSPTKKGNKRRLTPDGAFLLCLAALPFTYFWLVVRVILLRLTLVQQTGPGLEKGRCTFSCHYCLITCNCKPQLCWTTKERFIHVFIVLSWYWNFYLWYCTLKNTDIRYHDRYFGGKKHWGNSRGGGAVWARRWCVCQLSRSWCLCIDGAKNLNNQNTYLSVNQYLWQQPVDCRSLVFTLFTTVHEIYLLRVNNEAPQPSRSWKV